MDNINTQNKEGEFLYITKVNDLLHQAEDEWTKHSGLDWSFVNEALSISTQINYTYGIASSHRIKSLNYVLTGKFDMAREHINIAMNMFNDTNNAYEIARCENVLGKIYNFTGEFNKALGFLKKCLVVFQSQEKLKELATTHNDIGIAYHRLDQTSDAFIHFEKSASLYLGFGYKLLYAKVILNLGNCYELLGNFQKSMELLREAQMISIENNDKVLESRVANNLGVIYKEARKYDLALDNFYKSIEFKRASKDELSLANTLTNLCDVFIAKKEYAEALNCLEESLAIYEKLGDKYGISYNKMQLASVLNKGDDWKKSLPHAETALAISSEQGIKRIQAFSLSEIAQYYIKDGNTDKAYQYFEEAVKIISTTKLYKLIAEFQLELSNIHKNRNEMKEAYDHFILYHEYLTKEIEELKLMEIRNLQTIHTLEQSKMEAEIERLKNKELLSALNTAESEMSKAKEDNMMKTELLGMASHELMNPLNGIIGFADLIKVFKTNADEVEVFANNISKSSNQMVKLIKDLLEIAALEHGKLHFDKTPTNLNALIRKTTDKLKLMANRKHMSFVFELEENAEILADKNRMEEVFGNLIYNAIKYSLPGNNIVLKSYLVPGNIIRTEIIDNGLGLSEDDKLNLFKKFKKLSAQPTGGESSTGLGLSITQSIVELHQGKIGATSAGKNKGSTFWVEFPCL